MARKRRPTTDPMCWCGSGRLREECHALVDRRGPGALTAYPVGHLPHAVRAGAVSAMRPVPAAIPRPDYAASGRPGRRAVPDVRTPAEIEAIRVACREASRVLAHVAALVRPGVTTDQLDAAAHAEYVRRGVYPSTLNYNGYQKSICTSVNEVICHGIPDSRPLDEGDTVNVDVTAFTHGAHGDCSTTVAVGRVNPVARRLVETTRRCLMAGIDAVRPGRPLSEIGRAIEAVATEAGYQVAREYVGHGIGPLFHTGLQVPHHHEPRLATAMRPGMVFTIEPMINAGTWRSAQWPDGWTAVTADLARSAQFEHTVLVTESGVEVLTQIP